MKKLMSRIAPMVLTAAIAFGAGCAATLPNADAALENEAFGLLADAGAEHKMGPMGHMGHGNPMMGMFIKELGLSADQQARFKTLFSQVKASHQDLKPQFEALRKELKQAFLSDNFDAAALRGRISANLPEAGSHAHQMATTLIQAWQILTPDQQTKVVTRIEQMGQKMAQWQNQAKPDQGKHGQRLQKLAEELKLSPDQQSRIQAIWQQGMPDRGSRMAAMKAVKDQVLSELRTASPSADKIAAAIAPMAAKGQGMLGQHLDKIDAIHEILTPAQRQQLVTLLEQKAQQHRGHHR